MGYIGEMAYTVGRCLGDVGLTLICNMDKTITQIDLGFDLQYTGDIVVDTTG